MVTSKEECESNFFLQQKKAGKVVVVIIIMIVWWERAQVSYSPFFPTFNMMPTVYTVCIAHCSFGDIIWIIIVNKYIAWLPAAAFSPSQIYELPIHW